MLPVNVSVMHDAHKMFGRRWKGSRKGRCDMVKTEGLADTGCQTCIAGVKFLSTIGCPREYIVSTKHRIVGITKSGLNIIGAIFLRIEVNGKTSRQMVYISEKVEGLFLSEEALKDLGVIDTNFPAGSTTNAASCSSDSSASECNCSARTTTPERPSELPFPATPENVGKLKQWLIEAFESSSFNMCTHQKKPEMSGEPMQVRFEKHYNPVAVHTPIPVPHHWKQQVKADLDRDVRMGVIEPVPQGTVTTWCSRMVVAPKTDGTPRRTVDYQKLNSATMRETHHTPTPFNLVSTIPSGKVKTVLDAWNGYHSLSLDHAAKKATTFITEWGRYRYCRAPMGYHTSGDAYTRRFDDHLFGILLNT